MSRPPSSRLVGVPAAEFWESPSSWISRTALLQGATVPELLTHLGIPTRSDVDVKLMQQAPEVLSSLCGVQQSHLALARRIFKNLRRLGPVAPRFLLTRRGQPRYRFCPRCLADQRTSTFPVHWRFCAWRYCPLHGCLMEEECPRCRSPVCLPVSQLTAGPGQSGIHDLGYCMSCNFRLATTLPRDVNLARAAECPNVPPFDRLLLLNGRAVLSALFHGEVYVGSNDRRRSLSSLVQLERRGLLPRSDGRVKTLSPWVEYQ